MCLTGLPKWKFQEPPLINILGHDYSKQSKSTAQCWQSAIFITRYIFIHTAAVPIGNFEEDSLFHCQPLQVWHQQNLQTVIRRFNNETSHLFWDTSVLNTTYILDTPYIQCFTICLMSLIYCSHFRLNYASQSETIGIGLYRPISHEKALKQHCSNLRPWQGMSK